MQLDWVTTFVAVVDHGGFSAASDAIYRSQSRVSAHVASLERELDVALLERGKRPVELTAAGEAFLPHARAMLRELANGQEALNSTRQLQRGSVRFGTYPSAGATFVPGVLAEAGRRHPGIGISLQEHPSRGLDEALASGDVDLAVRPLLPQPRHQRLYRELLWREPMCCMLPAGHRLAGADGPVTLEDLEDETLILTGRDFVQDSEPYALLVERGLTPHVGHVSDQPQTLVALVHAGLGVGIINQLVFAICRADHVVVRSFADVEFVREVGLFWDGSVGQSAASQALREVILATPAPPGTVDLRPASAPHRQQVA